MPFKSDRSLYLNADRSEVVEEGDPAAAFLLVGAGSEIEDADAQKYGLKESSKVEDKSMAVEEDKAPAIDDATAVDPEAGDAGKETHVCPECGFEAKSAGGLTRHMNSHED